MTATIELNDSLINRAKKLSGITNEQDLLRMMITHYLEGAEIRLAAAKAKEATGNENPFWDGYDPKVQGTITRPVVLRAREKRNPRIIPRTGSGPITEANFSAMRMKTQGWKFNRDEANER
jgi:hypothetical protein